MTETKETVNHPPHYQGCAPETRSLVVKFVGENWVKGECIDAIEARGLTDFCLGNALKYLWRCGQKGGDGGAVVEDLKKAVWYFERSLYSSYFNSSWAFFSVKRRRLYQLVLDAIVEIDKLIELAGQKNG